MIDMSTSEFKHHIHEVFEKKYFGDADSFLMSKGALLDGLRHMGALSMMIEDDMEKWVEDPPSSQLVKECASSCVYLMRQISAITSILTLGLDGVHFKS